MSIDSAQSVYRNSGEQLRDSFDADSVRATRYYRRYVRFVMDNLPRRPARILDIGCGHGWITWLLIREGQLATGLDLHRGPLEARTLLPSLPYVQGDSMNLPFQNGAFDVVALHEVLEHVPDPRRALAESLRVTNARGRLIIAGPNLLSFPLCLFFALLTTLRNLRQGTFFQRRTPGMPRHPWGNTMSEAWASTLHHLAYSLKKLAGERPAQFLMRVPDSVPPFRADNDACYLLNPMDLHNWAKERGDITILRSSAPHHVAGRLLWPFRGGTWIVMEKK